MHAVLLLALHEYSQILSAIQTPAGSQLRHSILLQQLTTTGSAIYCTYTALQFNHLKNIIKRSSYKAKSNN